MPRPRAIPLLIGAMIACAGRREPAAPSPFGSLSMVAVSAAPGGGNAGPPRPLEFTLDPVQRDVVYRPASDALRGKRAVVIAVTTYDVGSLALLRRLGPVLRALPSDAACLIVALQPLDDRMLVEQFLDTEPNPCGRAMGDPARKRLGDLADVHLVPSVIVLRADGRPVAAASGVVDAETLRTELEHAR